RVTKAPEGGDNQQHKEKNQDCGYGPITKRYCIQYSAGREHGCGADEEPDNPLSNTTPSARAHRCSELSDSDIECFGLGRNHFRAPTMILHAFGERATSRIREELLHSRSMDKKPLRCRTDVKEWVAGH